MKRYLAIDIGASSGKALLAEYDGQKLDLEEVHRFPNHPKKDKEGNLYWDIESLFAEVKKAIAACKDLGRLPDSVGIDTWGVDYVLLDSNGNRIGHAHSYRDTSRDTSSQVHKIIPFEELYERTGIQFQPFNSIYQLYADKILGNLEKASYLMQLPDYLGYRLTGVMRQEYTNATTSGLVNAETHTWDKEILAKLGIKESLFGALTQPGTLLGKLSEDVAKEVGYQTSIVTVATHDTASAVLAIPLEKDEPYISSGTWSLFGLEEEVAHTDALSRRFNYSNEGGLNHSFRYQKNIMGLWMIQEVRNELGGKYSFPELVELAKKSKDDHLINVNSPAYLSPASMIEAIKSEIGEEADVGDLARVIYRSLAESYRDALEELSALTGKKFTTLHITGGGGNNQYLNALTAEATGLKVIVGPIEGTGLGNLLMQLYADKQISSLQEGRAIIRRSFDIKEVK